MFTRYVETSTTSCSCAPALCRMSRIFSITARVCTRMSSRVVPNESTSPPAIVLSARRALVPDTNRKSPARFTCGYLPRGAAFPSTTLLSVPLIALFAPTKTSQPDANVVQFRIKIQRMHPAFPPYAGKPRSTKGRSQVSQEPAIHPRNAHLHLLRHTMPPLQVAGPDRGSQTILRIVGHGDGLLLRIKRRDVAHWTEDF